MWALGVILYETATGRLPFDGFAEGRLPQLVETPPRAATLVSISPALDDLIARCLDRDPGKRPASMAAIARVLRGEDDDRITEDVGARVVGATRKRSKLPFVLAGIVVASGLAIGFALDRDRPTASAAQPVVEQTPAPQPVVEQTPAAPTIVEPPSAPTPPTAAAPTAATPKPTQRTTTRKRPRQSPPRTSQGETLD